MTTQAQVCENVIDFSVARPGTNVILVAEGMEIHVHKEFLSHFSPYFNVLLQSPNFAESSSPRVEIEYNYNELLKCVQIVYGTGPLPRGNMKLEDVVALMTAADRFDLPLVRRFCELELMGRDRMHTVTVDAYLLASHYQLPEAKDLLSRVIPTEDYKSWFDFGVWAPKPLSGQEMNLNLTPSDLHKLVRKVVEATKKGEREKK